MRLAVYCDYSYRIESGVVYAEMPFALFLLGLARHCEQLVLTGRLDRTPGRYPFRIDGVEYVPLPHYPSGAQVGGVLRTLPAAIRRFWRLLARVDTVWILGPSPAHALVFALMSKLRRRRVSLGVRQDTSAYVRHRHPDKRIVQLAALMLEGAFRLLARFVPVVVVGPDLARRYRHAPVVHVALISLLREGDIASRDSLVRDYAASELRMLSVGRLDAEKNPLLLADVLSRALAHDPRWRLHVCGSGPLLSALVRRLEQLGIADRAVLHGYVPIDDGLWELYRSSHVFMHVSLTEGFPQVLLEAFAVRLPVVATAVGGVPDLVRECGLLVPPNDAEAAAAALGRIVSEPELRTRFLERAARRASEHTLESECARLAAFLAGESAGAR